MEISQEILQAIPHLRRFARALTADAMAADDLVQDTIERALARKHQAKSNPRSWLFAIMVNLFRDGLRSTRRRPATASIHRLPSSQLSEPPRQLGMVAAAQVLEALQGLPEDRREALALIAVEGYSYKEAAEILDIPMGTLMSRLARGREQLRALLDVNSAGGTGNIRRLK